MPKDNVLAMNMWLTKFLVVTQYDSVLFYKRRYQ
jgi:hypothetical protein